MKTICITGGIGSGKSTVSALLEKNGARVIDADQISREVVAKGEQALAELVDYFGEVILDEEGNLDRKKLGGLVFKDKRKLDKLNEITTNKYIKESLLKKFQKAKVEIPNGVLVIEAIIPFDEWFKKLIDEIWVVTAELEVRIKRVMNRSGLSKKAVLERISSQRSEEEYFKIADKIIMNNNDLQYLETQVMELLGRREI